MRNLLVIFGLSLGVLFSCKKETIEPVPCNGFNADSISYLFLSHTRGPEGVLIDDRIASINFQQFNGLLLGGDLSYLSSESETTISGLDALFNFSSENTHWALGNHDITDRNLVLSKTLRNNTYYAHYSAGTTFIILDTEIDNSSITGAQLTFFNSVMDTITVSKNIVVIHHKLIWMADNPTLAPSINSVSNGPLGDCFYCLKSNNFYTDIYPRLSNAQQNGKHVYCFGGDAGNYSSSFHYSTPEGVQFYANGTSYMKEENFALVVHQSLIDSTLSVSEKNITCLY